MPTLNIAGKRVTVGDEFMKLSPEDQNSTVDEIAHSIGVAPTAAPAAAPTETPTPAPAPAPQPPKDQSYTSAVLPLSRDAQGNVHFDSDAGLVGMAKRAFMAPGDALNGQLQVTNPVATSETAPETGSVTPAAIERGQDFANTFAGGAAPATDANRVISSLATKGTERAGMEAADAAARLGVDLPRAVATDSPSIAQAAKIATNVPIAGTPLRTASQNAVKQLGQAADTIQQGYGSGDIPGAGAAVRQDIIKHGTETLKGQSENAYNAVDALVDPSIKTPLTATQQKAAEIVAKRDNATLGDSKATNIVEAATQPTPAPAPVAPPANPVGFTAKIADIPPTPPQAAPTPNPGLNYFGVKDLRTSIGEMIADPTVRPAGTSQNELRAIYGSLSTDLGNAAENAGGQAARDAWESANKLHAANSAERESLDRIIAPQGDEGLFSKIHSMAGTNSSADLAQLARARKSVTPDTWNEVASGVISKMGRDADGNFSPDRFVTAYGKLSPNGKNLLFRGNGKDDLAASLDDIATVSRKFKDLNQYANPSGTGQTMTGVGLVQGVIAAPISTISGVIGGRVLSSLLAKPVSAKALAAYSRAKLGVVSDASPAAQAAFANTSRAVAALAANAAGDKTLAQTFLPQLLSTSRVPANQGNENLGAENN